MTAAAAAHSGQQRGQQPPRDRVPLPANEDAERALLGAVLLDNDALASVQHILTPRDFHLPAHQAIYRRMIELAGLARPIDLVSLSDALKTQGELEPIGGYAYLAGLETYCLSSSAAGANAQIVREKAQLRELIRVARQTIAAALDEQPSEEVAQEANRALFNAVSTTRTQRMQDQRDLAIETLEHIHAVKRLHDGGGMIGIPSGLTDLDALLGGWCSEDLTYLAARPSIGKTAFAVQFALAASMRNIRTAYFSLEMSNISIMTRAIASLARVSLSRIKRGTITRDELHDLDEAAVKIARYPGTWNDCTSLTAEQAGVQLRILKNTYPDLQLAIIDGLWLMTHTEGERDDVRIANTSRKLKQLAKELGIHLMVLHQLSRKNEDRATAEERAKGSGSRPSLADLRGSGAIEQDADLVLFLHRERVKSSGEDGCAPQPMVETEVIVGKNRNGPIGDVKVMFETATQYITNAVCY